MRTPTPEQQEILINQARVRVVRAVPGSGKTWLVAELIRQELDYWPNKTNGIAALSFTRVGGDEIYKALGRELEHPHFVGTIDSFLFRYVVRPFFQKCYRNFASPHLIPAEWGAEYWSKSNSTIGRGINIFGCVFVDEERENGNAIVAHKPHPLHPLTLLCGDELAAVKKAKKQMWERSGRLTHSDAALCASKILGHVRFGPAIRAELVRRFPLIIVDELQDTGYFLGKSIILLVNEPPVRSVLVGDPDQAIFEFNGARPDLFSRFESTRDAVTLSLPISRRFSSSIARAASFLKQSGDSIGTVQSKTGRPFLVSYNNMAVDIPRIIDAVMAKQPRGSTKVISRQSVIVEALTGHKAKAVPKLGCAPLNHMQRAIVAFWQGHQVKALAFALAAIELVVFDYEGVEASKLEAHGIALTEWRRLAVDCLLRVSEIEPTGNLYDLQAEIGRRIAEKIFCFGRSHPALQINADRLMPQKRTGWNKECADFLPKTRGLTKMRSDVPIMTVHGVKGETHDTTIFVCPEAPKADRCPSAIWWSNNEKDLEEKRIAYVAMTRSQGDLIVCVSVNTYHKLCTSRKEFVNSFECMSVDEIVATFRR